MLSQSELYRQLLLLRRFDEKVLDEFSSGIFHGTTHTYLGQEANAVGIISNLETDDLIFSNHRCHGHFLAYGGTPHSLFAELMGRSTGVCAGRGGSQHIHYKNFYSSGVQGSLVPTAVGAALAEKLKGNDNIAVTFIGDGTLGQGVLYESLNMVSLWNAPVLFVVENNHIAQTTPTDLSIAGSIPARFEAFGITTIELSTSDVEIISSTAQKQITQIRTSKKPQALIINTHRFGPHSKGDDTRSPEYVEGLKNEHDPIKILAERMGPELIQSINKEIEDQINSAYQQAFSDPIAESLEEFSFKNSSNKEFFIEKSHHMSTYLESLNTHLHKLMDSDERIYLLGEDILDPYGSAFKVFKGLSSKHPSRVLTTPISEAGFVGVGGGMALCGLRPIIEIMFGDFLTLAADQIINSLSKFNWMYYGQVDVPMVIRTPMGGRRGYGATHSQTIEKHFLGVSGITIIAPCPFGEPGQLLTDAVTKTDRPVIFIENKSLYSQKLISDVTLQDMKLETLKGQIYPTYKLTFKNAPAPVITLTAYGYMAELARQAALKLAYEHEIFTEIIVPTQLSPFNIDPITSSARKTSNLLAIEEGGLTLGWGAEIITRTKSALSSKLTSAQRVAAADSPIPAAVTLEDQVLPNITDIVQTALKMV